MMAKKFNEYCFLILLLEKIEDGNMNDFGFDTKFLENINLNYKKITFDELEKIIQKCKAHAWIEKKCRSRDCPYMITERGKGIAVSKRKEFNENFWKKLNKTIGDYKNILYFIGFFIAFVVGINKIME